MNEYKSLVVKFVGDRKVWPPGSYGDLSYNPRTGVYVMACPVCGELVGLPEHTVDRITLTIHPSVVHEDCGAHFFVRDGKVTPS